MAKTVTFDEPEGFVPPENLDSDDTFQAMATFKVLPSNQLQLVDIEGYEVGEDESMEGEEEEPEAGGTASPTGQAPPANQSADQLAPGVNQTRTQGYAERLGQMFKRATTRGGGR